MSEIIDCEMHIGDEVFVHGYIDEIRNDTIIIRNVGGYFGTSRDEVFYYEEDGTMNKTEPTDCETCKFFHPDHEAIACERCLDGKYSRYEPRCSHTDCYYYDHFDADVCGRCTSKDEQAEREGE